MITSYLGYNNESKYTALPLLTTEHESNLQNIITTSELFYAEKKDILKEKITSLINTIISQTQESEEITKNIARFGFLPLEIREILNEEDTISDIQRSLSSLEIIKFSTALKVFSYLDSVISLMADNIKIPKDALSKLLMSLSDRGEKDVSAYVYMCYLNPFEITQDCNSIGDFDLYYQDILKERDFDRGVFKNIVKYIDILLEHSDIPSFSILFNGSNAGQQTINFTIEINTTKQDELKLMAQDTSKRIKNPHIFILTNLINLLKQSVFII
jgi:hypothetical protein